MKNLLVKHPLVKQLVTLSVLASALCLSQLASAGDAAIGKSKAASCAACHGAEGITANPEWPNLAAQNEVYLVNQLKNFRDGSRKNTLMSPMAASLSDDDIDNLAAYFSSLK